MKSFAQVQRITITIITLISSMNAQSNLLCNIIPAPSVCTGGSTFMCPLSSYCTVKCSLPNACNGIKIDATQAKGLNVNVLTDNAMENGIITCPTDGVCRFDCNGVKACYKSTIGNGDQLKITVNGMNAMSDSAIVSNNHIDVRASGKTAVQSTSFKSTGTDGVIEIECTGTNGPCAGIKVDSLNHVKVLAEGKDTLQNGVIAGRTVQFEAWGESAAKGTTLECVTECRVNCIGKKSCASVKITSRQDITFYAKGEDAAYKAIFESTSSSNSGAFIIHCDGNAAGGAGEYTCENIVVHAEKAESLFLSVGSGDDDLEEAEIYCPSPNGVCQIKIIVDKYADTNQFPVVEETNIFLNGRDTIEVCCTGDGRSSTLCSDGLVIYQGSDKLSPNAELVYNAGSITIQSPVDGFNANILSCDSSATPQEPCARQPCIRRPYHIRHLHNEPCCCCDEQYETPCCNDQYERNSYHHRNLIGKNNHKKGAWRRL